MAKWEEPLGPTLARITLKEQSQLLGTTYSVGGTKSFVDLLYTVPYSLRNNYIQPLPTSNPSSTPLAPISWDTLDQGTYYISLL